MKQYALIEQGSVHTENLSKEEAAQQAIEEQRQVIEILKERIEQLQQQIDQKTIWVEQRLQNIDNLINQTRSNETTR